MMDSSSLWLISDAEQQQNDVQFMSLHPVNGLVSGDQARPLLIKSALPPTALGHIWQLADYTKDGKMDRHEFSIAMHLIRTHLAGVPLPQQLPDTLRRSAISNGGSVASGSMRPAMNVPSTGMGAGMGLLSTSPMSIPPPMGMPPQLPPPMGMSCSLPVRISTPPQSTGSNRMQTDWSIAHHNKLKYCQHFNQLDKGRVGSLSGVHARNVLAQSGLPNVALAEIWGLSDVNRDGRLSCDEFCIAMHLIDSLKAGFALPKQLPSELLSMCVRSKSESPVMDTQAPPAQKAPPPRTFEDKRRDNYDRGQAELDRRRQILLQQEERRRAEQERKEREETERREREREEVEKRRRAEREAELERERDREAARQAEQRRIMAEKEEARREMERQRKADLNLIRIREVKGMRESEIDNTAQRQQRKKTLSFQLQAMDEKSSELNSSITQARDRIVQITTHIETMKTKRDDKVKLIRQHEDSNHSTNVLCERVAHESLQLQAEGQDQVARGHNIHEVHNALEMIAQANATTREQLTSVEHRAQLQQHLVSKKASELDESRARLSQLVVLNKVLREDLMAIQQRISAKLQEMRQAHQQQQAAAHQQQQAQQQAQLAMQQQHQQAVAAQKPTSPTETVPKKTVEPSVVEPERGAVSAAVAGACLPEASSTATGAVKYRALYEFNARTEDELSFQPGDIILVFEGHAAEPGWLAGQMRDKVGWFPLAFAEPLAPVGAITAQPPQTISSVICSPSSEPLQSITEEPPLQTSKSIESDVDQSTVESLSSARTEVYTTAPNASELETVLGTAVAQYQWKARNDSELNFAKGDTIDVLEKLEMRWRGRSSSGAVGWFPKSYVKMSDDESTAQPEQPTTPTEAIASQPNTPTLPSPAQQQRPALPIYDVVSVEPLEAADAWYIALYDFKASETTDLELKAGDRILVTESTDDWWKGTCGDRSGLFPANYVQKCPDPDAQPAQEGAVLGVARAVASFAATAENQLSLEVGDTVTIRSKSPAGWWQGEVVSSDGVKRSGWFPGNYVEVLNEVMAEAVYDYAAQREDELTFHTGEVIVVTEHDDAEWWKGRLQGKAQGTESLFPANYVRLSGGTRKGTAPNKTTPEASNSRTSRDKLTHLIEELLETEARFHSDLLMCREVFADPVVPIIGHANAQQLFLNLDTLIAISAKIFGDLRANPNRPGKVFVENMASLHAFAEFCSKQQSALELLGQLETKNSAFKQVYRSSCENRRARGLNLSYLILLPMSRITRYPLLFDKLIKYTPKESSNRKELEEAYEGLKARCTEANTMICEADNDIMLVWAQDHIRCPDIQPALLFPSPTREAGPRSLLHSAILIKQRSGKVMVSLLFNDFLMLTTPTEAIDELEGFKVTKNSELSLLLYKSPLLLNALSVPPREKDADECALPLKYGTTVIQLRATSRNARVLWTTQLEKAIDNYRRQTVSKKKSTALSVDSSAKGRLLVELICVRNVNVPASASGCRMVKCEVVLGTESESRVVDLNQGENLFTTQLPIIQQQHPFIVRLFLPRLYSPDFFVGEGCVDMNELVAAASAHRGPVSRQIIMGQCSSHEFVIVKFVVQMFY